MRLKGKTAIVVGAGQTPGDTIGNGRATAILFAREGANVLLVDRNGDSARETLAMIEREARESGSTPEGRASVFEGDVTSEKTCQAMADACLAAYGRIDILHNNVGIGTGDRELTALDEDAWDRILSVNLKSAFLACKRVLPVMRQQQSGAIINISSLAAIAASVDLTVYKVSKAGLNALTQVTAIANARYGIRVNAIQPGLIETPMAIESLSRDRGIPKDELIRTRHASVPLRGKMAQPGTSQTRPFFWPPTMPSSSQASFCRLTEGKACGSGSSSQPSPIPMDFGELSRVGEGRVRALLESALFKGSPHPGPLPADWKRVVRHDFQMNPTGNTSCPDCNSLRWLL